MIKYFSLPLIITGLFGILRSFRSKGALFLLTVSISLFLFFTYGISKNVLARNEEFSLSFSVVFIPFIIQGLLGIFDRIGSFKKEIMLASILFILLSFVNTSIGLLQRYPDYLNRMAAYLKCNLGKDDKVLLYNYYFQLNHIPVIVGFPVKRFAIANAGGDTLLCAPESINEYVDKNKPRYIVHSEKDESPLVFSNKGIVLNRIMKAGDYILYEVIYNNV
jgi:hypothetical protein